MNELRSFTFGAGSHKTREDGLCVMEAVALLAGEAHSDHPKCADPAITNLAIWLNDSCGDKLRQELCGELPWRIVGTKSTPEIEQRRAYMAADWAVRELCPVLLRRSGLSEHAEKLSSLAPVDCKDAASAAAYAARDVASDAARAASDAASDAVRAASAASDAASDAASYAVGYATSYAVSYAAGYATSYAVRAARAASAANAAASDLESIQRSLAALLDRMIRLTEPQEAAPLLVREQATT